MRRKMRGRTAFLSNDAQAFVEEASLARALHNCAQFAHVEPDALATRADVDLDGTAGFRGQSLAAFWAMHPVRLLQPEFLGF